MFWFILEAHASDPVGLDDPGTEDRGEENPSPNTGFPPPARGLRKRSSWAHKRPEGRMRGPERSSKCL